MCTAITLKTEDFYFGRNLDYEFSYGEQIVLTPRNFSFAFRHEGERKNHLAILGVAHVDSRYPLYYDAINEAGVGMAGLNFVGNAVYAEKMDPNKDNIAQFELIPWILSQARSAAEAKLLLQRINVMNTPFSDRFPASQLHYLIADQHSCLVLECVKEGIRVFDNPLGVLTNNPPFQEQLFWLNRYMSLSRKDPENNFGKDLNLTIYSRGMGALGLPGDLSSPSRFVKAAFTKLNSRSPTEEAPSVSQFFHILQSVEQQRGVTQISEDEFEITIYSTCYNTAKRICYYTSYNNRRINAIRMDGENLDGHDLITFPMRVAEDIAYQN